MNEKEFDLEKSCVKNNLISWYPFKSNSSILEICEKKSVITNELSNKCKKVNAIELSEINKIKELNEKYDYIFLNKTLEYAFLDSNNSYDGFITELKKYLNKNGKILIAIENRFGIKYWCGANEDHTNIPFDGIYNYINNNKIKSFTKLELEQIIEKCNMKANFYYMFPNATFPQIIYTDASLKRNVYANYLPFYNEEQILLLNETCVYRNIYHNKLIPTFANSFFIELSDVKNDIEIDFVKFNSFRKDEYNLFTYSKNKKYYKKEANDKAKKFLKDYSNSSKELEKSGFKAIEIKKDADGYYTDEVSALSLLDIVLNDYKINGEECLLKHLKEYEMYLASKYNKYIEVTKENAFNHYKVKIGNSKIKKLHFLKKAYIDIIPQNMLYKEKDYYLIDQEWTMENVPYEFVLYRGIINVFQNLDNGYEIANKYLELFNLLEFSNEFCKLEKSFQISTLGNDYFTFEKRSLYKNYNNEIYVKEQLIDSLNNNVMEKEKIIGEKEQELANKNEQISKLEQELANKNEQISKLEQEEASLTEEVNKMLYSRSWKITKPIRYVKKIIKK